MKELPNEVWKVRDIEMDTETFNRERKISNCTIAQRSEITKICSGDSLGSGDLGGYVCDVVLRCELKAFNDQ